TIAGSVNYFGNPTIYTNSAGNPANIGTYPPGSISKSLTLQGAYKIFYGPAPGGVLPSSGAAIRSLPDSTWDTVSEFIINTGANKLICFAIPENKEVESVEYIGVGFVT